MLCLSTVDDVQPLFTAPVGHVTPHRFHLARERNVSVAEESTRTQQLLGPLVFEEEKQTQHIKKTQNTRHRGNL